MARVTVRRGTEGPAQCILRREIRAREYRTRRDPRLGDLEKLAESLEAVQCENEFEDHEYSDPVAKIWFPEEERSGWGSDYTGFFEGNGVEFWHLTSEEYGPVTAMTHFECVQNTDMMFVRGHLSVEQMVGMYGLETVETEHD